MQKQLKQVFIPYWKWECYNNGMYNAKAIEPASFSRVIEFMKDTESFVKSMNEVCDKWSNSMLNFLSNNSINKKAYIGQCAVFYKLQEPENVTKKAWKELTEIERILANIEAEKVINRWEQEYMIRLKNTKPSGLVNATKKDCQMKLQLF